jgi:Uma2 family endonuclease
MGTRAALPVAEYLRTSYPDLDKEYRDGELVERSLPDNLHSKTQGLLIAFFVALRKAFPLFTRPELRLKIRTGLYLIPDGAVFHPIEPAQRIPDTPPYIVVEVLSLDDKPAKVLEKLEEYRTWGVPHVWLVDPHLRHMYTFDAGLTEVPTLKIPELGIEISPADIFE